MIRAIYGGSFNPIHFGHLGVAKWVLENTRIEELWLMVTPNNPLKKADILAPERERFQSATAAVAQEHIQGLVISDFEFSLPKPNYTAQTLRLLSLRYPDDEWILLIGEDNWQLFPQWREWKWILANYEVMIYPRHSTSDNPFGQAMMQEKPFAETDIKKMVYLAQAPYFDISSTQIREKMQKK